MIGRKVAVLLAIALFAMSCGGASRPAGIVLITLDTTRADHLGCYGDAAAVTPNLDALAKEGVRFEQAMTAVPTTLPSHATMFTGVYPPSHGVRYNGMFRLTDASVTVAKRLHDAGFATRAVPAAAPVAASSGLGQGFDVYLDLFSGPNGANLAPGTSRPASEVTKLGLEAIDGVGAKPFFLWLHYYDAHYPYDPPFPFSAKFREHPYDGEIAFIDKQLGVLFEEIKKRGLWDRLAIVVAGDHGEGLYEHGERMHSELAYQSTLRVPLLVKAPGARSGTVVKVPVTLADVAPTILDLAGQPVPSGLDGITLREALRGTEPPARTLYFETLAGSLAFGWSPIEGIRRGKWKLIRSSDPELYDLEKDPAENENLAGSNKDLVTDLTSVLEDDVARWSKSAPASASEVPADPDTLARLASLGYIGGTVSTAKWSGRNPKDLVHLESELLLIQDFMTQRDYAHAMLAIPGVLANDPDNRLALQSAADASAGLRNFDDAERYARKTIEKYPESLPARVTLGRTYVARKDYPGAEKAFREGLEKFPDEPILVYSLALTLIAEKRPRDAEPIVLAALGRKNPDPGFHVLHALCRAMAKDDAAAKAALEKAMAAGYTNVDRLRSEPLMAPLKAIPGFDETIAPKKAG
ncbi:MAG TPA: sulfatase-like hydrolase/transferase [Candidatus Polarisedimenticolaceae bacterium]|nr:sulfatase-like hydrolase/transferase [Candidatus Polarisedimenticolaceae bacterium]